MASTTDPDQQRRFLQIALKRSALSLEDLWLRYFALGGDAGFMEVEAYLHGLMPLASHERDVLAHALNEFLDEQAWTHRIPYARPLPSPEEEEPPLLRALTRLLQGTRMNPEGGLPAVLDDAARVLGVEIVAYLVDYDQRVLRPLHAPWHEPRRPLAVDTTLAGRAFRHVEPVLHGGGRRGVWMPLLDGVERLGVLDVTVPAGVDPDDPGLRRALDVLVALLGHLVVIQDRYTDDLDQVRRTRSRKVATELVWQLLPSLTFGTDAVVLSGAVEPAYDVGGDAFDYAVRGDIAHVAIFDATGHSLKAGLVSAAAISAYRSGRRNGASLYDTVRLIDDTVAQEFGSERFVTSVLLELDVHTGEVRYVNAGHARPLLLRGGKVVKVLAQGRRPLLGLGTSELTVGEERLEPGDWIVLYTDGVTEARDEHGDFFGEERLIDFLEREAATMNPPPETLRRLMAAVLSHQDEVLQDDATVVLAQWTGPGGGEPQHQMRPSE